MKAAIAAGVFVFVALFALTTFVPSPEAQAVAAANGFTPQQIEEGLRYSFQRKLLFWSSTAVWLTFLTWLVFSGGGRKLADFCNRWTRGRWLLTVLLVGGTCFLAQVILFLPFGLARLELQRFWDMTHQALADWLRDQVLSVGVGAITGAVVLVGFYLLVRWFPRVWWLVAALGGGLLGMAYAFILPVVIEPLFNDFRPLEDVALQKRVQALAARAGVTVDEVLVADASRRGNYTNAYFTGFGATQRIVLYDTLVKKHPPDEVESILAHEIGHWQHHHIVKGIALATLGGLLGLVLLASILRWAVGRRPFCLTSPADPAGLPLILLLLAVGSWLALPVQNAISRYFEAQADQAALELDDHPKVFIEAQRRLATDNIGNVAPNPWSVWLFATHPTAVQRIEMAKEWERRKGSAGHPKSERRTPAASSFRARCNSKETRIKEG